VLPIATTLANFGTIRTVCSQYWRLAFNTWIYILFRNIHKWCHTNSQKKLPLSSSTTHKCLFYLHIHIYTLFHANGGYKKLATLNPYSSQIPLLYLTSLV
jgi:hypothetical protein